MNGTRAVDERPGLAPMASRRAELWRRGPVVAGPALLLGLILLLHGQIPNGIGHAGSLVETFLPWLGLFVPLLLAVALWRRFPAALAAVLLPAVVWSALFGAQLARTQHPGRGDLVVVEHNVGAGNPDPAGTARALAASGADVLALVELTDEARGTYERVLAPAYPFHTVQGTVGVWSTTPLSDTRPVDLRMDYGPLAATKPFDPTSTRALRTTVTTAGGPMAVYVAHLASTRVNPRNGFDTAQRDRGADALRDAVAAEPIARVVLLGDLNGSTEDRAFAGLTAQLRSAQDTAGGGFGFSWPAALPVVRIDQILVRGVTPSSSWVLPATGSDHLPVAAGISW